MALDATYLEFSWLIVPVGLLKTSLKMGRTGFSVCASGIIFGVRVLLPALVD